MSLHRFLAVADPGLAKYPSWQPLSLSYRRSCPSLPLSAPPPKCSYGLVERLTNTLLKDEESARDNHVLAGNFAKYSPI